MWLDPEENDDISVPVINMKIYIYLKSYIFLHFTHYKNLHLYLQYWQNKNKWHKVKNKGAELQLLIFG